MQHMVPSLEFHGAFNGDEVIRTLHDTEDLLGPMIVPADPAGILVGQVETERAEVNLFLHIHDCLCQFLSL